MKHKNIVDAYIRNNKYDWILSECKPGQRPIEEVIEYAVFTWTPKLKECHRNYSAKNGVRDEMTIKLRESLGSLGTPASFEDIMKWVYTNRVEGFASVGVYDTALRIGIYFGIYPTMVYIHAGSETGTKNVLGNDYKTKRAYYFMEDPEYLVFDPSVYPLEINKLDPYHIENFLCQKKEQLQI
ncbi:hypothetical protein ACOJQI_20860 [Bacillus salacetis]|uniref:hypothetical protein n=1 Tax=Bacillus salacetis TaxID=2315464 RepID=UPI003BA3087F